MKITIATSQFSVSSDIDLNMRNILTQMKEAKDLGCDVIHFPEGSLSGYAGVDFFSFQDFDWDKLKECTVEIIRRAGEWGIWVVLGSAHPLSGSHKPHNSIYIINDQGQIEDRYDKQFCAGDVFETTGDLAHYSPGDHFSTFTIKGVKCGTLICHEYRYPELYRELKKKKVDFVFHSYHAGNMDTQRKREMEAQVGEEFHPLNPGKTLPEITMPSTMISYAGNNYLWISCSNTSAKESCWASFVVRPDGVIVGRLEKNQDGILITRINTEDGFYDSTRTWRDRAMKGKYFSGEKITDPRSEDRKSL